MAVSHKISTYPYFRLVHHIKPSLKVTYACQKHLTTIAALICGGIYSVLVCSVSITGDVYAVFWPAVLNYTPFTTQDWWKKIIGTYNYLRNVVFNVLYHFDPSDGPRTFSIVAESGHEVHKVHFEISLDIWLKNQVKLFRTCWWKNPPTNKSRNCAQMFLACVCAF